jgi:hypothetical protein
MSKGYCDGCKRPLYSRRCTAQRKAGRCGASSAAAVPALPSDFPARLFRSGFAATQPHAKCVDEGTSDLSRLGLKRQARDAKPDLAAYLAIVAARPGCE